MPLPRPCDKCNRRFEPTGKFCRLCNNCLSKVYNENFKKMLVFRTNKFNNIRR